METSPISLTFRETFPLADVDFLSILFKHAYKKKAFGFKKLSAYEFEIIVCWHDCMPLLIYLCIVSDDKETLPISLYYIIYPMAYTSMYNIFFIFCASTTLFIKHIE